MDNKQYNMFRGSCEFNSHVAQEERAGFVWLLLFLFGLRMFVLVCEDESGLYSVCIRSNENKPCDMQI